MYDDHGDDHDGMEPGHILNTITTLLGLSYALRYQVSSVDLDVDALSSGLSSIHLQHLPSLSSADGESCANGKRRSRDQISMHFLLVFYLNLRGISQLGV